MKLVLRLRSDALRRTEEEHAAVLRGACGEGLHEIDTSHSILDRKRQDAGSDNDSDPVSRRERRSPQHFSKALVAPRGDHKLRVDGHNVPHRPFRRTEPPGYPSSRGRKINTVNGNAQNVMSLEVWCRLHSASILHRMMEDGGETEAYIHHVLAGYGLLPQPETWEIVPAAGGLNSRVYFARQRGQTPTYTIRLPTPDGDWRLRREADVLMDIHHGCPGVPHWAGLFEGNGDPMLVHDYAPGAPARLETVSDTALTSLASCLAGIHAHHRPHYAIWPWLRRTSGSRAGAFLDRLAALSRYTSFETGLSEQLRERVGELYVNLKHSELRDDAGWDARRFSQLHGDLSVGNMIWDGDSVTLIDWEYARDGDPAEDLAYLFSEQPAPERTTTIFQHAYIVAGGDPCAVARAAWYAPLVALDSALWWGDYHLRHGNDPSTAGEVLRFIEIAEASLRDLGR